MTAMIMLTSSEDVCQSSITFARMNVMARSLYEERTSIEEVRYTNCSATIYQLVTGNTVCATHTYVVNVCICGLRDVMSVPSFSLLCNLPGRNPPPSPNQVQHYTNLFIAYLLYCLCQHHHNFLPGSQETFC